MQRGTFRVDGGAEKVPKDVIRCTIHYLDGQEDVHDLPKNALGQELLDHVYNHLDIMETDYFGVQFADAKNLRQWVQPDKKVKAQLKKGTRPIFYFRVKFYVPTPGDLQEEVTRYQYFLQVKQDLIHGKLDPGPNTLIMLGAYAIQAELGDYDASTHQEGYVSVYHIVPNQTAELEAKISEQHKTLMGLTPADCELEYLRRAQRLSLYGIEMHSAVDTDGSTLQIGISHEGVIVFSDGTSRVNTFPWAVMRKMAFKRKKFFLYMRAPEEQEDMPELVGFRMVSYPAAKKLWKASVEHHTFFRQLDYQPPKRSTVRLGSSFRYSGRTFHQSREFGRQSLRYNHSVKRVPSKRFNRRTAPVGGAGRSRVATETSHAAGDLAIAKPNAETRSKDPKLRAANPPNEMDPSITKSTSEDFPPPPQEVLEVPKQPTEYYDQRNADDEETAVEEYPEGSVSEDGLVTVRMEPDPQTRFGFNVKGGSDQGSPIKVSRVSAGSPAAKARPKLNEGDLVIAINGENVTEFTHEQVVMLIRSTRERNPPILILTVKPVVPVRKAQGSESQAIEMVDEMRRIPPNARPEEYLKLSMDQLRESMKNSVALRQFDQLYRRKPNMAMTDAMQAENFCRNRYRDIAPYDATRVKLQEGNDYINASFVKMNHNEGVLEYIAAQGPLAHTVDDIWQLMWEQNCSVAIMATVENEAGRAKCHRYWPEVDTTNTYWKLEVSTLSETVHRKLGTVRKFNIKHVETSAVRTITQYQYVTWPDHGEPESMTEFIDFIMGVNQLRVDGEPLLVHCSAGVGRTGMLIVMEAALVMMKNQEAVYPLDLVRLVRNQRPMVIQTASQFGFVCEAVLHAYDNKLHLRRSTDVSDETDRGPGFSVVSAAQDVKRRREKSESSSDESDSDSDSDSDSESSSDDEPPRPGQEDAAHIRLNPLAMDDDY